MKGKKLRPMETWESYVEEYPEGWIRTTNYRNADTYRNVWKADYWNGDGFTVVERDASKYTREYTIKQLQQHL